MTCLCCGKETREYNGKFPKVCPDCRYAYNTAMNMERRTGTQCDMKYIKYLLDQNECSYCHYILDFTTKHIDHIIPVSRGGTNDNDNLCISCVYCNEKKKTMTGDEYRAFLDSHPEEIFKRNTMFARNIMGKAEIKKTVKRKRRKTVDEAIKEGILYKDKNKLRLAEGASLDIEEEVEITEKVFILDEIRESVNELPSDSQSD